MITKTWEGWMLCKSMLHSGGNEKTGSTPTLRSIMMYTGNGQEVQMPYLNGNGIRGKLRRLLMKDFFNLLDIDTEQLDVRIYHTFFTGGALESTSSSASATLDLPTRRKMRHVLKPLALLGCAFSNQMMPSVLKVGHAFPICQEYEIYLPEFLKDDPRVEKPVRTFTDESFQTRKDDLRAEREEGEQATQMKVDYECFVPGTKFYHWFGLEQANEFEESCFGRFLELFKNSPYLGGMSAIGNGEVIFGYDKDIPDSKQYVEYTKDNKAEIIEMLDVLEETK